MSAVDGAKPQLPNEVGFIGLGNMGSHMIKNLIKKNYKVVVYDINKDAVNDAIEAGATAAVSPADMASKVKIIITIVPSSKNVLEVYTAAKDGIFNCVQPGSLLLDCTTMDPQVSRQMEEEAAKKQAVYMDAPVSGGFVAARDATLTFMVGGTKFEEANAVLQHMGKNVVHCGPVGTGQAAKICNNMLLAISMIGTAESLNLGMKLGIDPKMMSKIINMSSGHCWSSEVYNPCPGVIAGIPSSNNYEGGAASTIMVKDLGLAQAAATSTSAPIPLGGLAHQIYRVMCNSGYAMKDFSSVFQFLQEHDN